MLVNTIKKVLQLQSDTNTMTFDTPVWQILEFADTHPARSGLIWLAIFGHM